MMRAKNVNPKILAFAEETRKYMCKNCRAKRGLNHKVDKLIEYLKNYKVI